MSTSKCRAASIHSVRRGKCNGWMQNQEGSDRSIDAQRNDSPVGPLCKFGIFVPYEIQPSDRLLSEALFYFHFSIK